MNQKARRVPVIHLRSKSCSASELVRVDVVLAMTVNQWEVATDGMSTLVLYRDRHCHWCPLSAVKQSTILKRTKMASDLMSDRDSYFADHKSAGRPYSCIASAVHKLDGCHGIKLLE